MIDGEAGRDNLLEDFRSGGMEVRQPHAANLPGGYFVEDGCCLTCEVPLRGAPGLFAWADDGAGRVHCDVKKQPETAEETEPMFSAIQQAEASCIHYRGHDRKIQERLVDAGEGAIRIGLPPDLQA